MTATSHSLSTVIPAERLQAREPGSMYPCRAMISEAGVLGSRIGSLREPSGMTIERVEQT
jgi:hypothetical protein